MDFPVRGRMVAVKDGEELRSVDITILNGNLMPLGPFQLKYGETLDVWIDGELADSVSYDKFSETSEAVSREEVDDLCALAEEFGAEVRIPDPEELDGEE